jgi:hypothetical protein
MPGEEEYPIVYQDGSWEILRLSHAEIAILPKAKKSGSHTGERFASRQGLCAWVVIAKDGNFLFFDPDHVTNTRIRTIIRDAGAHLFSPPVIAQ